MMLRAAGKGRRDGESVTRAGPVLIAVGGYSKVYRYGCRALKVCERSGGDSKWLFLVREGARHRAIPRHPNVLPLLDILVDERRIILVTPLQDCTLRSLLSVGPLTPTEQRGLRRDLAEGIAHLHGCRLIHCDLKPDNVLVARGDKGPRRALLSDFGISLRCDEDGVAASVGQQIGTVGYRAPELVVDGWPASLVTRAADVWALGCTLLNASGVPTAPAEGETEVALALRLAWLATFTAEAPLVVLAARARASAADFARLL
jgi:serine/threonine protein kinase